MVDDAVKDAYRSTLDFVIDSGRAPHYVELAHIMGVSPDEARLLQHQAADAGIGTWFVAGTDFVECWAPFSNVPTNHLISIDGVPGWYGQCGLEALAVTWVVPDRTVETRSYCLDCADAVSVVQRNGEVLHVEPPAAVGHMNEPFANGNWATSASFI